MKYSLSFVFVLISLQSFCQKDSARDIYQRLDTMDSYTNIVISTGPDGFFINEKRVDKKTYEEYKKVMDKMDSCKPCWVKNYTVDGGFVSEGAYYSDCYIGTYIEYFPGGKHKITGHYKENHSGNWTEFWNKGFCNVKDGKWIYYDQEGRIRKTEQYHDGKLVN
jgi:antitoxin component YwqK of YwqJK toxin-antitoxin module